MTYSNAYIEKSMIKVRELHKGRKWDKLRELLDKINGNLPPSSTMQYSEWGDLMTEVNKLSASLPYRDRDELWVWLAYSGLHSRLLAKSVERLTSNIDSLRERQGAMFQKVKDEFEKLTLGEQNG